MTHVGIGYDVPQLIAGRKLFLGGVEIPHTKGLDGHSHPDALMHAICDAILGALGEPDIGHLNPSSHQTMPAIRKTDCQFWQRPDESAAVVLIGGHRVARSFLPTKLLSAKDTNHSRPRIVLAMLYVTNPFTDERGLAKV